MARAIKPTQHQAHAKGMVKEIDSLSYRSFRSVAPAVFFAIGFFALYLPTYYQLSTSFWRSDSQSHGPIVLAVVVWLFWDLRSSLLALKSPPAPTMVALSLLSLGCVLYFFGRVYSILLFEMGSQLFVIASFLLAYKGYRALRLALFPLFFMLFMMPLPSALVNAVTMPMKLIVSIFTDNALHWLGYPVSRAGVILYVGQYKLLVADACAGLHTLFTLEAMGLLYLRLINRKSWLHIMILALSILPISLLANSLRVMILALVTYHWGDAAGQGFLHGFASIVLFLSALFFIMLWDFLLAIILGLFTKKEVKDGNVA